MCRVWSQWLKSSHRKYLRWCTSCISFALIMTLEGCRTVINPYTCAPSCHEQFWDPCDSPGIPIPPCALIDPFLCTCQPHDLPAGTMSLCDLVDLGLRNSQKTRQTWADARIAATRLAIQKGEYFPEINFESFFEFLRTSAFFGASMLQQERYVDYGPSLNLSYLLFDGGTRMERTEMFRQQLFEANWIHNREIQTVAQTIMNQYYNYMALQEQVIAAKANLEDANTVLLATQKKHRAGITDLSDVLIAQTQVSKQQIQLLNDTQDWVDSFSTLKLDIGIPANTPMDVEPLPEIQQLNAIENSADAYIAQSYLSRPDLFASYSQVQADIANVKAAIRNQYPTVQLDGNVGSTFYNGGESDDYDYAVQLTFQLPLFKGFIYRNEIRKARSQLQRAWATMRELELQIIEQVVQSHQDFLLAVDKVQASRTYLETATLSFDSTLSKYRAGTTDITTVVNALSDLADARSSMAAAQRDWYSSLVELAYATGILNTPCWR